MCTTPVVVDPAGLERVGVVATRDPVLDPVRVLTEAVARVQAWVVDGQLQVPGADAVSWAVSLHAAADAVRALAVSATVVVDELDAARVVGCASTSRLLEQSAGMSRGGAGATVALGRTLTERFHATREAWLSGEVSEAAVREITVGVTRAVAALPPKDAARVALELEAALLRVARTRTVAEVRRAAARLRVVADPEGAASVQERALEEQYLRFTPVHDGVEVNGRLTHEAAAGLITALDRVVDGYHRRGEVTALQAQALASGQPARRRATREHLHALAVADLATTALDAALLGHRHEVRPHLTYTVHHDELESGLGGWLRLPGHDEVPLPTTSIDRALCDADIHPVLTTRDSRQRGSRSPVRGGDGACAPASLRDAFRAPPDDDRLDFFDEPDYPDGSFLGDAFLDGDDLESFARRLTGQHGRHVLDLGRTFRTAPPALRRALDVRDRHCTFPGCAVDPSRCQAHHVVHWRHGGETSLRNMALLCLAHHHTVHEGGWTMNERPGTDAGDPHRWTFTPPLRREHPDD